MCSEGHNCEEVPGRTQEAIQSRAAQRTKKKTRQGSLQLTTDNLFPLGLPYRGVGMDPLDQWRQSCGSTLEVIL